MLQAETGECLLGLATHQRHPSYLMRQKNQELHLPVFWCAVRPLGVQLSDSFDQCHLHQSADSAAHDDLFKCSASGFEP